ncbi:MAG: riboflavin synthase [Solirubrobacterales bacterium]
MFTGLIADVGKVKSAERSAEGARLRIATKLAPELADGDSIAVNGACLTAAAVSAEGFEADVMNQTLSLTSLGPLEPGDLVNLELALRASDRLGGHIVQGHIDGTGTVAGVREDGIARRIEIKLPGDLARFVVDHGSVALDGVSLTVAALTDAGIEVSLIPETLERTNLGVANEGDIVNVEIDVVARYVERLLSTSSDDD